MELVSELSIHICPNCQSAYRMAGVHPGQEITCFKCGFLFRANKILQVISPEIHEQKPSTKKTTNHKPVRVEEKKEALPKKRPGGTWTWMIFLTFILYCLVKAVSEPTTTAMVTKPETPIEEIPIAETAVAEIPTAVPTSPETPSPAPSAITTPPIPEEPSTDIVSAQMASSINPPSQEILSQANALFESKDYAKASESYRFYLAQVSSDAGAPLLEAYWKLAVSLEKSGDLAGANLWNEKIIQEFGKEKDWKIRSAQKALSRLQAAANTQ